MDIYRRRQFSNAHATLSQCVITPGNGQQYIEKIIAKSDKAASVLKAFPASVKTRCRATIATAATKVIPVDSATISNVDVAAGDYMIVFTPTGVVFGIVASISKTANANTITLTPEPGFVVTVGDTVYIVKAGDIASMAVGAAQVSADGMFIGQPGMPLALTLDSTSAGNMCGIAADAK